MSYLQILSSTINSITLGWHAGTESAKRFELQRKNDVNKWITIYTGLKRQVTVKDLHPSESYHFRIFITMNDDTSWSSSVAAVTKDQPLAISYLHRAIEIGNLMKVKTFLKSRAGVLEACDRSGRTALILATINGCVPVLSLLLDCGANINFQNSLGRTSLMSACSMGNTEIVQILLDRGATLELKDRNGCTAINYAADSSNLECLKLVLDSGANIESRDNQKMTVLMRAVLVECSPKIISELIVRGAKVDVWDDRGVTCLMLATLSSQTLVVELLLQADAVADHADIYNNTALDMALAKENKDIINVLKAQKEELSDKV